MGPHDHEVADDAQLATDLRNQAELQTLADMLRGLPPLTEPDDATDDSECQRIVELVERIGIRPQTAPDSGAALLAPNSHRLGQYKLLAKLGQGGMGAVYKALHTKLDKLVALKVLPADRLQDAAAVARFEREMRAVGKLAHENIVAAMDAGEIDGTHYLVMELVAGVDLGNIARERAPLPVAEACEIIRQAALGLQHAHIHNLVHRDIKPSNLMLAQGSCGPLVKILDMGLALLDEQHSEHADLTASGQIMGTLDYMAPEQAGDTHTVDIRADIYSLGATLYKLLTGRVPFQGPQYTSTVKKLMALSTQDPPRIDSFREDLPPELVDVVHRMLARQPEDRYATPGEVAAAMAAFAAGANLAAFLEGTNAPQGDADQTALLQTVTKGAASVSVRSSVVETQSQVLPGPSRRTGLQPAAAPDNRPPRRSKRGVLLAGAAVPIVVLLGVILLSLRTPHGEIVVELADDIPAEAAKNLKIEVIGNGQVKVADASAGWTIDIAEGKYQAKLSGGADQFQLEQNQVTVTRGEKALLKVSLKPLGETPTRELHAGTGPAPDPSTVAPKTWQPTPEQRAFFDHVATLPADEQAAAVAQKLMEVNPGFDGTTEHKVEGGQVTYFRCRSEHLTDIWSIRALAQLKDLDCGGTNSGAAKISDLSPLRGMALTSLTCWRSPVVDISPLSDMPLTVLDLRSTTVTDLSPLRGVQLTRLFFDGTHVNDLSPLSGMPLERINFNGTSVDDLAPLRGMRLTRLQCGYTNITDLSALQGMPLEQLACSGTRVADLSPLTGMPLTHLEFAETKVRDLSPLRGMPLTRLNCGHTSIADISSLQGMKLTEINLYKTPVSDLSVLTGMPLQKLFYDVRLFDEGDRVLIQSLPLTHLNGPSPAGTPILITQKELDARREAALAFADATSHMSPAEQVKAVVAKLAELNEPNVATLHVRHASNGITDIILTLEDSIHRKPFDITPLMGFTKLKTLEIIGGMPYLDISFTKHFSLEELYCDDRILLKNIATLKNMPSLKRVNGHPVDEYLDYVVHEGPNHFAKPKLPPIPWDVTPEQQAFFDHVATLPAEEQAEAVAQKLMEANPGFDGKFEKIIRNGQVVGFRCHTDKITNPTTDVWPIRAFRALQEFYCRGSGTYRGNVTNLDQLRGMRLTSISLKDSPIRDLSPLIGMPLSHIAFYRTSVADLSPLRGMPLEHVMYDVRLFNAADEAILHSLPLRAVNKGYGDSQPIAEFWQELAQRRDAAKAFAMETSQLPTDKRVTAVQTKLNALNEAGQVRLMHKLEGEHLAQVEAYLTGKAADLTPLMALTDLKKLFIYESVPWQDLSCLKFLPLEELTCSEDAAYKNNGTLRAIKTLKTINGEPAEQFWQKLGVK